MSQDRRKELIAQLEATPGRLLGLVGRVDASALHLKPDPEAFSLRENVHHVRDIDVEGFLPRLMSILTETDPALPDVDGGVLARERRYNDHPHASALEDLARIRTLVVRRLRSLEPAQWLRTGRLAGAGTVTLERLLELWCAHDTEHLAEVARLVDNILSKGLAGAPDASSSEVRE